MIGLLLGLFVACIYDYRQKRIPNWLIFLLLMWGCVNAWGYGGVFYLLEYVCMAALVVFIFFPLFRLGMFGAGDVKLLGVCAPFFPSDKILEFLFSTMAISAVLSIIKMLVLKNYKERFFYFCQYVLDCVEAKRWKPYFKEPERKKGTFICIAGPVFISVLLYWGGFY